MKSVILISILLVSLTASAQWLQKSNFTGVAKAKSTAFAIGNKIYVMGGVSNAGITLHDFREYDITTNTWTPKPNFPGPERYGAVSFVLNNKGYIATGGNDNGYLDDLWQYDPSTSTWTQKTGLPAGSAQHENQRREAWSFVAGGKAYMGGGDGFVFGPNSTLNTSFYDIWEYNPATDNWTQKAGIPDFIGRDFSIAVAINNKGYVGLGCNVQQNVNHTSFWEYDPLLDSWTAKADFPNNFTVDAGAFVLDSALYLVGGVNLNPVSLSNQFYTYDPITDVWTQLTNFNGGAIAGGFAVSTGTTAFVGTGYNSSLITRSDLWEFITATGINENNLVTNLAATVYPNPATESIEVTSLRDISFIEIYNAAGMMVIKQETSFKKINIQNVDAGVYTMKLTFKDGSTSHRRFMKIEN